ncbi:MAG: hypothetical protein CM15mP120_07760 [Pseudomonadota bacterium]|nr:MAG: hypothetical protein CM15mP120_07760 [Pseudomonadota bacterium]
MSLRGRLMKMKTPETAWVVVSNIDPNLTQIDMVWVFIGFSRYQTQTPASLGE